MSINIFERAKSRLKLLKLSKGSSYDSVIIQEAPKEWSQFLDSKNSWVALNFPIESESTGCLFKGKKGEVFPPHKHSHSGEQLMIINEGGKIEVITKNETKILEFPNSYFFKKNEVHAIIFLEDTEILVKWTPRFDNKNAFDGHFLK
jgi:quercetin dioxygenase-like cupin family protein